MLLTLGVIGGINCEVGPTNSFAVTLDALLQPSKFGVRSLALPATSGGVLWHVPLPKTRCVHLKTICFVAAKNKCVFDSGDMVVWRSFPAFVHRSVHHAGKSKLGLREIRHFFLGCQLVPELNKLHCCQLD
jgi:hypothetical protein